jgi:hypothetical protein
MESRYVDLWWRSLGFAGEEQKESLHELLGCEVTRLVFLVLCELSPNILAIDAILGNDCSCRTYTYKHVVYVDRHPSFSAFNIQTKTPKTA